MTSDNISPIHLMDIKRVAFETKPVSVNVATPVAAVRSVDAARKPANREQIAKIVDSFLSKKLAEIPEPTPLRPEATTASKAVVHEITPENAVQKPVPVATVDFVSEDDVRRAVERGDKIYISKKTILTPSARDLGEEKEVFARI